MDTSDSFNREAFAQKVGLFLRDGLSERDYLLKRHPSPIPEPDAVDTPKVNEMQYKFGPNHFVVKNDRDGVSVVSAFPNFRNEGVGPDRFDWHSLKNLIEVRMEFSQAGKTDSVESDKEFVSEAYSAMLALELNGKGPKM